MAATVKHLRTRPAGGMVWFRVRRRTTRLVNGAFFAAGLGGLAWLIHRIGPQAIGDGLARVGPWFAAIVVLHLIAILLDGATLKAAAGPAGDRVGFWVFARASLAGHGINQATPLGKMGEITKVTTMAEELPTTAATGALIVQNFVMFVVNCAMIAIGVVVAALAFDVDPDFMTGFWVVGGVFAVLGVGALALMWRGVGDLPLRVARWFGVKREDWWHETAAAWAQAAASPHHMRRAFAACALSRCFDFVEAGLILHLLGIDQMAAATVVSAAGYQVVYWGTSFVPMQAGTAEGGAYLLFQSLGLPPTAGVLLELIRRARRLVFVAIALGIVGWQGLRGLGHTEHQ